LIGEFAVIDIANKWALITGASRGIGRQVALALADKGCNLVLHSRKNQHTDSAAIEVKSKGVQVLQLEAELSEMDQVKKLGQEAETLTSGIDILYNNAAIMTPYRDDIYSHETRDYIDTFIVNTIAPIKLCACIIPKMVSRGFGRVVNVTSGIKDEPQLMPYAASKAALDKYVYDTAPHLKGTGVLMNLLDPGWLRTDLGGPKAPHAVESVIPGALIPVLLDDGPSGELFQAQAYRA